MEYLYKRWGIKIPHLNDSAYYGVKVTLPGAG